MARTGSISGVVRCGQGSGLKKLGYAGYIYIYVYIYIYICVCVCMYNRTSCLYLRMSVVVYTLYSLQYTQSLRKAQFLQLVTGL